MDGAITKEHVLAFMRLFTLCSFLFPFYLGVILLQLKLIASLLRFFFSTPLPVFAFHQSAGGVNNY